MSICDIPKRDLLIRFASCDVSIINRRYPYIWFFDQDGESPTSSSEDLASFLGDMKSRLGYNKGIEVGRDDRVDENDSGERGRIGENDEEEGGGAADSPDSVQADVEDSCDAAGVYSVWGVHIGRGV